MAKTTPPKPGTSRIRFVMLDAEISDGDLAQVTQAIQNALRPPIPAQQQRVISLPTAGITDTSAIDHGSDDLVEDTESSVVLQSESKAQPARSSRPRAPTVPKVIEYDLSTPVSLTDYTGNKTAKTDIERFLIISAWFKECRSESEVTADHVYTAFRALGWSTSIKDFSQPLRDLKSDQYMSNPSRGRYAINHLGIARVEKLTKRKGDGEPT